MNLCVSKSRAWFLAILVVVCLMMIAHWGWVLISLPICLFTTASLDISPSVLISISLCISSILHQGKRCRGLMYVYISTSFCFSSLLSLLRSAISYIQWCLLSHSLSLYPNVPRSLTLNSPIPTLFFFSGLLKSVVSLQTDPAL